MQNSYTPIIILLSLCIVVVAFARWFDRRYYIPFLNETLYKHRKEPVYNPNLLGVGLLAAGGGLLIWTVVGCIWVWFLHK